MLTLNLIGLDPPTLFSKSQKGFLLPQGRLPDRGCQQDGFPADKEQRKGGTKFLPLSFPKDWKHYYLDLSGSSCLSFLHFPLSHCGVCGKQGLKHLSGIGRRGYDKGWGCEQRQQQDLSTERVDMVDRAGSVKKTKSLKGRTRSRKAHRGN